MTEIYGWPLTTQTLMQVISTLVFWVVIIIIVVVCVFVAFRIAKDFWEWFRDEILHR